MLIERKLKEALKNNNQKQYQFLLKLLRNKANTKLKEKLIDDK